MAKETRDDYDEYTLKKRYYWPAKAARRFTRRLPGKKFTPIANIQFCLDILQAFKGDEYFWPHLFRLCNTYRLRYLLLRTVVHEVSKAWVEDFELNLPNYAGDLMNLMLPTLAPVEGDAHFEYIDAEITGQMQMIAQARAEPETYSQPPKGAEAICDLFSTINHIIRCSYRETLTQTGKEVNYERLCSELMWSIPEKMAACLSPDARFIDSGLLAGQQISRQHQVTAIVLNRLMQVLRNPIALESGYIMEQQRAAAEAAAVEEANEALESSPAFQSALDNAGEKLQGSVEMGELGEEEKLEPHPECKPVCYSSQNLQDAKLVAKRYNLDPDACVLLSRGSIHSRMKSLTYYDPDHLYGIDELTLLSHSPVVNDIPLHPKRARVPA